MGQELIIIQNRAAPLQPTQWVKIKIIEMSFETY